MKVFPTLTGTLLLSLATTMAQNTGTPLRWAEGAPNASSDVKNDIKIEGLKTDELQIFVSLAEVKETEYNRVSIELFNHSKTPIDFDPQTAILVNEKDKTVRPEVPTKAANSIQKYGEAKSNELSSAHCSNMIATQCQPTPSQAQVAKQVAAYSAQQAQWVRDNGLTQKSVAPGDELKGCIIFRKDKKKSNYILKIPVAGQTLEFPVTADNKAPSFAD